MSALYMRAEKSVLLLRKKFFKTDKFRCVAIDV